eukprot:scaffold2263_cov187-Ochromonas_danica.AAC.1
MCGRQAFKWQAGEWSTLSPRLLPVIRLERCWFACEGFGLYGLYHFGVVALLYTLAFTALTYSFVELVSIVPFSGGCYGYSRCALGPFMGYVAGMFETAKYILYATFNIHRFGYTLRIAYGFDEEYQIFVWLAFVVLFNLVHYFNTKLLWLIIGLLGLSIFVIQIIFIFGATSVGSAANLAHSRWNSKPD